MRHLFALIFYLFLPAVAFAQSGNADRDFLTALIEDNLSGAGRDVRIVGFSGALSSRAMLDEMTIADADGVWLTMRGVVLDWSRSALLSGRIEVRELTADEIIIPRLPNSGQSAPSPEATVFSLPELPVSVNIEKLQVARVVLGEALFGQAAEVSLSGAVNLAGGAGRADISVTRIDGSRGVLTLAAGYQNETKHLDLNMQLSEGADGIVANLIDLPGRPEIDLSVTGAAPLSDFTADVQLSTDGQKRLAGTVSFAARPVDGETEGEVLQVFSADIGGDIAPVFAPVYRPFFGPEIRLVAAGQRDASGRLQLDKLRLTAQAIDLEGKLALGPDGWPESLSLTGRIESADKQPVILPLSGPKTSIGTADLSVAYDIAKSDGWTGLVMLERLRRDGVALGSAQLVGGGRIMRGEGTAVGRVTADFDFVADGIDLDNKDLMQALGENITGAASVRWAEKQPVEISDLRINGDDYALTANVMVQGLSDGFQTNGDARVTARDLGRFSGLAGRPLRGGATVDLAGQGAPLGGSFDLSVDVMGQDLGIGQAEVDRLLAGRAKLSAKARRDETGTYLETLKVEATALTATASGTLRTGSSDLVFKAALADVGVVTDAFDGEVTLDGTAAQSGQAWTVKTAMTAPGNASADLDATLTTGTEGVVVSGDLDAVIANIAPYSGLAKRKLGGAAKLKLTGGGGIADQSFNVDAALTGQNLSVGQADVDQLLRGNSTLSLVASGKGGAFKIAEFDVKTPEITASANGTGAADASDIRFEARLRDIGLFTPDFSGPLAAQGSIGQQSGRWTVDTSAEGPGGTTARVSGSLANDMRQANLDIAGQAPLALANRFIRPRTMDGIARFDLSVNGPLALSSVSGTVATNGGRLSAPTLRMALTDVNAQIALTGGGAAISLTSPVDTGGQITVSGPMALSAPFNADLAIVLGGVGLIDPALYKTTVDGRVTVVGPLTGGAKISGALNLGQVDIQIPSTGFGVGAEVPEITHKGESAASKQTRSRAGLDGQSGKTRDEAGVAFPVDLLIRAPSRIFIRGRGLDAELGGRLRLVGTTAALVPQGRFDLIRGRLDILGKRLVLSEGYAQLLGQFSPYLRLVAETDSGDVTVRIVIEGTADAPDISFLSSPELPQDEVLARLLFGRGLSQISPLQAAQLAAAVGTLAGKGGVGIIGKLREGFGLDDFDVTTDEAGNVGLRAGKYLTEKIYTDVTVGADGTSEINLNLTVTPSVTAKGMLGSDGNSGLGVFFEKDY
ncbi:translocation/assembly module TamB domain-containing protein [Pseudogemmobacter sp. W21_MBD1_M6]|uniref:translocation/assembly module TamB domain-containing protein n=1 Tax=Pseudogemmobacter sp. W21_MBD1_M6 TaxID=3240271 RepID=UPI003F980E4F